MANNRSGIADLAFFLVRLIIGLLFACHGAQKTNRSNGRRRREPRIAVHEYADGSLLERALAGTEPAPTQFEHNDLMRMRDLRREPRIAVTNREFCFRRYSPDMAVALCQRNKGHIGKCGPRVAGPKNGDA